MDDWITLALNVAAGDKYHRHVAFELNAMPETIIFASVSDLASRWGMSERKAQAVISNLLGLGLLIRPVPQGMLVKSMPAV